MGEMVQFQRPDGGGSAGGYLAEPAGGAAAARGGVVVIHEWWGLRDDIKRVADRIAGEGYRALAVDLYGGKFADDADEAGRMMQSLDWGGALADIRGALDHLKQSGGKAAVLGFCLGGALAIVAGVKAPEVDAVVCFYGIPPDEAVDPTDLTKPFIGHFANIEDNWVTPERVDSFARKVARSGVLNWIHRYDARHAFFNDARPDVYDPEAAAQAWQKTLAFLERCVATERST